MSVGKHRDFLDYWDSRLDENEKILINYPQMANFTFSECNKLWDVLHSDYAALLARHNALREAVEWERKAHSAYNDACVEDGYGQLVWATENLTKARAEVDRLLMEEK